MVKVYLLDKRPSSLKSYISVGGDLNEFSRYQTIFIAYVSKSSHPPCCNCPGLQLNTGFPQMGVHLSEDERLSRILSPTLWINIQSNQNGTPYDFTFSPNISMFNFEPLLGPMHWFEEHSKNNSDSTLYQDACNCSNTNSL